MNTVHVKLFASLRRYRPGLELGASFPVELASESTVGDLVRQLGLPEDEIKLVFVNALYQRLDFVLSDGDELGIFPPVGGG